MKMLQGRGRGRPQEHNWKTWTNGRRHTVKRKQHFSCQVDSFMDGLRKKARALGGHFEIRPDGDTIEFQFIPAPKKD